MNFIFNLTWREIRSSWRRLLFFFLCIAIGVGSVVALRSLIQVEHLLPFASDPPSTQNFTSNHLSLHPADIILTDDASPIAPVQKAKLG